MRFADVTIEGEHIYTARVEDANWNGWACPWFSKDQCDSMNDWLNEMFGDEMHYDSDADAYICDDEVFYGKDIDGEHLYPIGNGSWVWQEC